MQQNIQTLDFKQKFPADNQIFAAIQESCRQTAENAKCTFDEEKSREFLAGIDAEKWKTYNSTHAKHGIFLPLKFDSVDEELNMICFLSLLNILSGYRATLHRLHGRGAWMTILQLGMAAGLIESLDKSPLSAKGMVAATESSLASLLNIPTHIEKDHPTMGSVVKVGEKDEEFWEILKLLVGVLNETGEILEALGVPSLGKWVSNTLEKMKGDSQKTIHLLVQTFPAFNDSCLIGDQYVYFYKKALFMLNSISVRWAKEQTFPYPLPTGTENFPVFSDNVIPSVLIHYGVTNISQSSVAEPFGRFVNKTEAAILRATALYACHQMVTVAHEMSEKPEYDWMKTMTEEDLDGWLWGAVAKTEEGKRIKRFHEKDTVFY